MQAQSLEIVRQERKEKLTLERDRKRIGLV
jgi:hypothetical protein